MSALALPVDNVAWGTASPRLSILIPFLRDDPSDLLEMLSREALTLAGQVEIVVLDDGTDDAELTARLSDQAMAMRIATRLISLARNEGRSLGRNRLAQSARGRSLLFLDSDMRPDSERFVRIWLDLVEADDPAVAFGGFSLLQAPTDARYAVHRAMATRSDCIGHHERALQPEKHVFTSNLLVRRDVFDSEGFDPAFSGWGWEDVEWAMRVSRRYPVLHIDNTATHMGLDTAESLAAKYEQSVANFARVVAGHPDIVATYPSYRAARMLKHVPGLGVIRPLVKRAALNDGVPVRARGFALRLYRAMLYAQVV